MEESSYELQEIRNPSAGLAMSATVVDKSLVNDGETIHLLKESNATLSDGEADGATNLSSQPGGGREDSPHSESGKCRRAVNLAALTFFAAIGGCLFGYDTGVVSGAMILVDETFDLSHFWHELIVSVTVGAAAVAAIIGGVLADALGRKPVLIISSVIFTAGAVLMAAAPMKEVLLAGRVVVGLGIGLSSMSVPLYIAESSPASMRGKLVVLNVAFITGGQFLASVVDGVFSEVPQGWRYMLGIAGIPSLIMLAGMLFMPESPRWLVFHKKGEKARRVLLRSRTSRKVEEEMEAIEKDYVVYKQNKMGFIHFLRRLLTERTVLLALVVGCGLQMFQQLSGINTVMYYSGNIIKLAGFNNTASIWLACVPSFGNFIFTLVGEFLVDRIGRRKLILGSITGVIFSLLAIAGTFHLLNQRSAASTVAFPNATCHYDHCLYCVANQDCGFCAVSSESANIYVNGTCSVAFYKTVVQSFGYYPHGNLTLLCNNNQSTGMAQNSSSSSNYLAWFDSACPPDPVAFLAVGGLFLYLAFFAPGMGPVPWTINSEIYPTWARSFGMAASSTTNWVFNLFVSLTFLSLLDAVTPALGFVIIAIMASLGLVFIFLTVPETKGLKLEDIEELFKKPYFVTICSKRQWLARRRFFMYSVLKQQSSRINEDVDQEDATT